VKNSPKNVGYSRVSKKIGRKLSQSGGTALACFKLSNASIKKESYLNEPVHPKTLTAKNRKMLSTQRVT
jgi:hypothetical protein